MAGPSLNRRRGFRVLGFSGLGFLDGFRAYNRVVGF